MADTLEQALLEYDKLYATNFVASEEQLCVVSDENRTMTIFPTSFILGVESDEHVKRIKFRCPRYVGEDRNDLMDFDIRINYQNANGDKDGYLTEDKTIEGDYVFFTWLLGRKVTKVKGQTLFNVCAIKTNADGTIEKEWNSTPTSLTVLQGLEVDYDIDSETMDYLTQYKNQILVLLRDEAERIKETIPPEYRDLFESITDLREDLENTESRLSESIANISDEVLKLKFGADIDFEWASGNITSSGDITTGAQSNYYSRILSKNEFVRLTVTPKPMYQFNFAYYNGTTFVRRGSWSETSQTIDNEYSVRILIATTAPSTSFSIDEMLTNYVIDGLESDVYSLKELTDKYDSMPKIDWIKRLSECSFSGNNIHLSFDDVSYALFSLKSANPNSIYDVELFRQVKELHDTYGVCITLNCFLYLSTEQAYDIASIPNKWKNEFQNAKSWLKFSFHGRDDVTTYDDDSKSLKNHYNYFVNAIYHMTEDYECIDRIIRTQSFTGTENNIKEVMTCNYAPIAFMGADRVDRLSYYLNAEQSAELWKRGKYIDAINNVLFIKTTPRLDNDSYVDSAKTELSGAKRLHKFVEIFAHANTYNARIDTDIIGRISEFLTWIEADKYNHEFLMSELS